MPSKASCGIKQNQTFANVVDSWETERKLIGHVQPYTAKESAEKARLLLPWLGGTDLDKIDSSTIKLSLIELGQYGVKAGKGLSSSTLRVAHLAGPGILLKSLVFRRKNHPQFGLARTIRSWQTVHTLYTAQAV